MALLLGNNKKVYEEIKSVLNMTYDEFTKLDPSIKESWIDSCKAAKLINKNYPNRWKNNFDIARATKEVFEANQELAEINRCLNKNLSIEEYFMMDSIKKFNLKVSAEAHKQQSKRVEEQVNFPTTGTYEERLAQIASRARVQFQSYIDEALDIENSEPLHDYQQEYYEKSIYNVIKEELCMSEAEFLEMEETEKRKWIESYEIVKNNQLNLSSIMHGYEYRNPAYKDIFSNDSHIDKDILENRRIAFLTKKVKNFKGIYERYSELLPSNLTFEEYLETPYFLKEPSRIIKILDAHMQLEDLRKFLLRKGSSEDIINEAIREEMFEKRSLNVANSLASSTDIPISDLQTSAYEYLSMTSGCIDGVKEFCIASPDKKEEMRAKYFNLNLYGATYTDESKSK